MKLLFWAMVLCDLGAMGLMFLLGLAAAKPSHTSSLSVVMYMVVLPGLLLLTAILVFLFAQSALWRGAAFLLAASPVLVVVLGSLYGNYQINQYRDEGGNITHRFRAGKMREVEAAILKNDAAAVKAAARGADLTEKAIDGSSVVVMAIRELQKKPGPPDALRALLEAGADPNAGEYVTPLNAAIQASAKTGLEPIRLLLDAGAKPNAINSYGEPDFFSATGVTAQIEVLQLLLERGADLTAKGKDGGNVLSRAVMTQNWKAALFLLERGVDWKQYRSRDGLDLRSKLEKEAQMYGEKEELRAVLRYLDTLNGKTGR